MTERYIARRIAEISGEDLNTPGFEWPQFKPFTADCGHTIHSKSDIRHCASDCGNVCCFDCYRTFPNGICPDCAEIIARAAQGSFYFWSSLFEPNPNDKPRR